MQYLAKQRLALLVLIIVLAPALIYGQTGGTLDTSFGYAKKKKIKLYGKELELISDPVNRQDDDVFVDAREEGTDSARQVQVPRNVVQMAKGIRRNQSQ